MTLSNSIRAQEEVPTSQSGSPTTNMSWIGQKRTQPQSPQKIARSALPGDSIAITPVTNHSIFIKWPYVKLLELKKGVPTSQSGSSTKDMDWTGENNTQPKPPPK